MAAQIIEINSEVAAVRGLRAASAFPRFLALCCVIFACLLPFLEPGGWKISLGLIAAAAFFGLIAVMVERGWALAVWSLAFALAAATILSVLAVCQEFSRTPLKDTLGAAAGFLLMFTPAWLLVSRGVRATFQSRRRPVSSSSPGFRHQWRQLPRDARLRLALGTFVTAIVVCLGGALIAAAVAVSTGAHMLIAGLVYLPVAHLGGRIWNRGQRQLALRVREVRALDTRRPVLLLRSFGDDNLPLGRRYHLLWFFHVAKQAFTLEELVVDRLWHLGPVVAIGNPGEALSPLGAAREYVPATAWTTHVQKLLDESDHVASVLGSTPGLNWELQQIELNTNQRSIIVVIPPLGPVEIQQRWQAFQRMFKPAQEVQLQWSPFIGVPLLAIFSRSNEPLILYCKFRNETAYATAFGRLFAILEQRRDLQPERRSFVEQQLVN